MVPLRQSRTFGSTVRRVGNGRSARTIAADGGLQSVLAPRTGALGSFVRGLTR